MNETVENAMKTYKYIHLVQDKKYNDEMINYNLSTIHVPTNVFDKGRFTNTHFYLLAS